MALLFATRFFMRTQKTVESDKYHPSRWSSFWGPLYARQLVRDLRWITQNRKELF
jgi:hypothetical protein